MATARPTPALGIALGAALVVIGIGAYVLSEFASITALIPAIFGVVIAGLGVAARQTRREKLAILGIGVLSLLGVLGSARGIPDVIALLTGGAVDSTVAAVAQGSMILIGLVLFVAAGRDLLG
ncbi:hypothetical protein RBH26_12165 [Natronolimnohabitans sp. A-GB9]|uniref:hypothetical protein n=1 Tax=Natronolimnohabitans sp. A-GB9 TaxID=3069757 RepID=UPI0027B292E2|nr:hypothetical protein [Natronolimnohabitans sp. A-GB9]MDQ2051233.1 hypothetical protein [Natronolimnohabitans sp. A-GB9]